MHKSFRGIFAAFVFSLAAGADADTVIDGAFTIVTPVRETSGVYRALDELAGNLRDAIEESVGLRLEVKATDAFAGGRAIYLGAAAAERAGLLPEDLRGYDNAYAEKDGDIYLFGRDASGKRGLEDVNWYQCFLPTVKAAARFMEDVMDVRFLAPGKVGMDVPRRKSLALAAGTFSRHHPDQMYAPSRLDTMLYSYAANQFGCGAFHTYGGHTYRTVRPSVHFKDHPEYFALVNGRRSASNETNPSLCISNPVVEDLLVDELLARYDEGAQVCQLGQQDGLQTCECESCRNYGGIRDDVGEQLWLFHRRIAERIAKLRPGKLVQIISYGQTATPPKTFRKFPPNVMIETCRASDEAFALWKGYDVPNGFTAYIYLWGNYPFMGAMAKHSYGYLSNFVKMLQRNGVHGIYRCGYGEFYGTEGPGYYVFNTLLDRPKADVNALVDEYCRRAYGPASRPMREFHDAIDERLRGTDKVMDETEVHGGAHLLLDPLTKSWPSSPLDLHAYVYTPDVVARLDRLLAKAETTPGLSAKQVIRLRLVRREYDYARTMGRIAVFHAAYRAAPSKGAFDVLADEIERRNRLIDDYTGGGTNAVRLAEWPEIRFFGGFPRKVLETNGRLLARIDSPLRWDVKRLREMNILPGTTRQQAKAAIVSEAPEFGDFESCGWKEVRWQNLVGARLQQISRTSRFKVLAGPDALYVAAEGQLPQRQKVLPSKRDSPLVRRRECFELMLAPQDPRERYYRFAWAPVDGSVADGAFGLITDDLDPKYNQVDWDWEGTWNVRNERTKGSWKTLARIPYETIGAARPRAGDRWFFNLGRLTNLGTERNRVLDESLWNPMVQDRKDLCDPEAMGVIEF